MIVGRDHPGVAALSRARHQGVSANTAADLPV